MTPSSVPKYPTGVPGAGPRASDGRPKSFFARNPSALIFIACLAVFTLVVTLLSEAYGPGVISTSFVKTLGKTLCLCLVALAMDLIWGYAGILSLGHMAFFALGGYMIGMWLMYARTEEIVVTALAQGRPSRHTAGGATGHRHPDLRRRRIIRPARDLELCPFAAVATDPCAGGSGHACPGLWLARLPQRG